MEDQIDGRTKLMEGQINGGLKLWALMEDQIDGGPN